MLQHLITYPEDIIWRLDILLYTVSALLSFSLSLSFRWGPASVASKLRYPNSRTFGKLACKSPLKARCRGQLCFRFRPECSSRNAASRKVKAERLRFPLWKKTAKSEIILYTRASLNQKRNSPVVVKINSRRVKLEAFPVVDFMDPGFCFHLLRFN